MTTPNADPLLWTIDRAAAELGLSKGYLYRLAGENGIEFVRVGRRVMFNPATLRKWIEGRTVPAARR